MKLTDYKQHTKTIDNGHGQKTRIMKPSYDELLKENARLEAENKKLLRDWNNINIASAQVEITNKVLKQNIENAKKALDLGFE